ncbi:uncharacterized protein LOC115768588 [Drosophila novamexicana]|uniref:uncharacterized protein LOC115768588 n=1 Tax=Drosophila novamexicana TaxID=47314 RepID=UPI0011E5CA69|nr:uncharacterized protein LOC115768588 [Drosophila novamexicana]
MRYKSECTHSSQSHTVNVRSTSNMQIFTGIVLMLLLAVSISARPQRRQLKSQRQVELASTPYPAAGFRPRIPFDLPSERQPKLEEPLATTTAAATTKIAVEDFGTTETQSTTELLEQDVQINTRTPANTYGAPEQSASSPDDTVEVVAQAPARDFQPPVREAVEDFAAVAVDGIATEQQPVADLPALDQAETPLSNDEELPATEIAIKAAATPASTYGAPNTPASSYGAPELEEPDNELETDESQVELVEEAEEAEEELNAAALGLASGRLVLLPINAAGAQFGRLILAVEQPKQPKLGRQRIRSERLRRRH